VAPLVEGETVKAGGSQVAPPSRLTSNPNDSPSPASIIEPFRWSSTEPAGALMCQVWDAKL
jgi:hypothetical protein